MTKNLGFALAAAVSGAWKLPRHTDERARSTKTSRRRPGNTAIFTRRGWAAQAGPGPLKGNGTQACRDAFAKLSTLFGELTKNAQAAVKAQNEGKTTAKYVQEQNRLKKLVLAALTVAKEACKQ